MFFKVFPCRELLDRISLIHKYLEFPLSKQKIVGTIDCGKLCFLTMQNYVAHQNWSGSFLQKGWAPVTYSIVPLSFIRLWKNFFIRVLKSTALNLDPLVNSDTYSTISCTSQLCNLHTLCLLKLVRLPNFLFSMLLFWRSLYWILFQIYTCLSTICFGCLRIMPMHIYIILSTFVFIHRYRAIKILESITLLYNFIQHELINPKGIF